MLFFYGAYAWYNTPMPYHKEHAVITRISREVLRLTKKHFGSILQVATKSDVRDISSFLDNAIDRVIRKRISAAFPADILITEEFSPHLDPAHARAWVVDPLCGSMNVARGVKFFATNIALVEGGKVVAAWVIDHAREELIWGLGDKKVYRENKRLKRLGVGAAVPVVEVDHGYFFRLPIELRKRIGRFTSEVLLQKNVIFSSHGSSLGFAYVATGQLQAAVTMHIYPWDFIAECFLIEQNGGVATNFNGSPWSIRSKSIVMAGDKNIHRTLLRLLKKNKLDNLT
jgi:myo-inositol-1(or 4)-monophosphatase